MHQNHSEGRWTPASESNRHSVERPATAPLPLDPPGELVPDGPLSITITREDGVLTLEVCGEVDLNNAGTLEAELARAESSDAGRIVLDLSRVDFIDSSGLRVLLLATQRSARDSNRLGVIRGTGQVSRVLTMTGIDDALKLLDWDRQPAQLWPLLTPRWAGPGRPTGGP